MREKHNKKKKQLNSYIQYSGLTIQMACIIFAGVFFGNYLDEKNQSEHVYSITLSLISIFLALYFVFKKVINNNEKK
tara:strand:- start:225 stop:455 length:231 start_codon:yes stop_codon:yes gene_type:complete